MQRALFLLSMAVSLLPAQAPVEYSAAKKIWVLHTDSSAYAMGVNERGELQHLYWGGPLWRADDIPAAQGARDASSFDPAQSLINEEFPGWGGTRYMEPSVKITRADGVRDLVLHYASHEIQGDALKIRLKDINDDIFVTLSYKAYVHEGIIRKSAVLENRSKQALEVESMQGGVW
jgi:alpha-galactosidase